MSLKKSSLPSGSDLIHLLQLQVTELEMLSSMYPTSKEFAVGNPSVVADIDDFIQGKSTKVPPRLDFTLHLGVCEDKDKWEVYISLPHDYPATEPEVYVRSSEFTRDQQHRLNEDVSKFVSDLDRGELCIGLLIQWLQDNATKYFCKGADENVDAGTKHDDCKENDNSFTRLWIYSHHIFNKFKRRSILELGTDFHLTGFCLPGKPGIICIEGMTQDCNEFWQRIKHMSWKKIVVKKTETDQVEGDIDSLRRFKEFQEISFQPRKGPGREYHMDMGEFYRFLEDHQCGYAFQEYFGVEGRVASGT